MPVSQPSASPLFGDESERAAFTELAGARAEVEATTEDAMTPLFITSPLLGAAIGFTYTVSTAVSC
ncbi:hypothetical protein EV189_0617 [Motilibacter rhizosphaerae]|uniref:Uncharacterized protein n=1 Tax=Motilibacter rhizosphaerae TaxID=598652 RepID=A0A4Q7NVS4_9ACTN|nr:hypothetical protein [Motilibacter rhizosphaerae]RZS91376.1 hypothetical protein EV189_0617 [Motilibacter rhizosphaerae]